MKSDVIKRTDCERCEKQIYARWVPGKNWGYVTCSNCENIFRNITVADMFRQGIACNYCPNCGAKMDNKIH